MSKVPLSSLEANNMLITHLIASISLIKLVQKLEK